MIPSLHRATRTLVAFAILNLALTTAVVGLLSPPDLSRTSAAYAAKFALRHAADDSWKPMLLALDQARTPQAEPIYQSLFFRQKIKFQYPPSSLLALDFLQTALGRPPDVDLLNNLSWLFVLALAALVPAIYLRLVDGCRFPALDRRIQAVTLAAMTLTFYPITRGFVLGQIQTWLTCLFAAAVLAWIAGRQALAGVLIGAIVAVKPQLGLLLVWAAFHRQGRFLLGAAATVFPIGVLSVWRYGLANHLDYLSALSFMSAHGESFYANQSANGLLARLLHIGNNLEWDADGFPPYHPVVYYGTLATSAALTAVALLWRRRDQAPDATIFQFLLASLCFTMASPIAWEHHYGILAPMYAVVLAYLFRQPSPKPLIALAASYVLTANALPFANRAAETPWNFVQSYLFAGALLLVAVTLQFGDADRRKQESELSMASRPPAASLPSP